MPLISLYGLVRFAPNVGVFIEQKALGLEPQHLHDLIGLAWQHMDDSALVDACCGARGPLAEYHELDFEEYLRLIERVRVADETGRAKQQHTRARRAQYSAARSRLVLQMIEHGIPHVCSDPGCTESQDLTIDHLVPLSKGGSDALTNLRFMCRRHNSGKGDR